MREGRSRKKVDRKQFVVGDWVRWTSQAAGSLKTKTGQVVEIISKSRTSFGIPNRGLMRKYEATHRLQGSGWSRDHESYLVEVQKGNGKPMLYHPRVSALEGADA